MGGHRISQHNVQRRSGKGGATPCVPPYWARSATADVLPCWPRSHLVAELLTLVQIAHSRLLDSRNMHEHVLRAIVGLDEAVALLGVEPLYGSSSHCKPFKENYAAPTRRSNFGAERKANLVLDTSEKMA